VPSKLNETAPWGAFPESSFRYTPLQHLRWIYCRFVQGLFHAAPRGAYHWEPDATMTEIVITGESVVNASVVGLRPAVSFTRGPLRFFTLGHDDMLGFDMQTGQKKKSVLVPGTISVNCCSRNDLESEQIAWVVAEQLWMNRDLLMKTGFFEVGREPAVGSPSPAGSLVSNDSGEEWYATTITCPFQFYRTGTNTPLGAHIANSIGLSLNTSNPIGLSLNTSNPARIDPRNPPYSSSGPFRQTDEPDIADGVTLNLHTQAMRVPEQGYPYAETGLPYAIDQFAPPAFSPASDAHGASPDPAGSGEALQLVPHPLNPSKMVVMRAVRAGQRGVQPPSIHGRPIPISRSGVEESASSVEVTSVVKV